MKNATTPKSPSLAASKRATRAPSKAKVISEAEANGISEAKAMQAVDAMKVVDRVSKHADKLAARSKMRSDAQRAATERLQAASQAKRESGKHVVWPDTEVGPKREKILRPDGSWFMVDAAEYALGVAAAEGHGMTTSDAQAEVEAAYLKQDERKPFASAGGAKVVALRKVEEDAPVWPTAEQQQAEAIAETAEQLQKRLEEAKPDDDAPAEAMPALEPVILGVKQLQAALLCAGTNDIRTYINTVKVHRVATQSRIVSTDGHRMLVLSIAPDVSPSWLDAGVLLSAGDLGAAMGVCAKHGDVVTVEWGIGHTHALVKASDGFCTFRVAVIEGTYPDYARVLSAVDLSNQGGDALAAAQLNPAYVKSAAQVAKVLEAKTMQTFAGDETKAAAFLFGGADAVMVIMPIHDANATRIVTTKTIQLVGSGLASSIGALRAHMTRCTNELAETKDRGQIAKLTERRDSLQERIDALLRMSREALPAPTKKAA